MVSAAQDTGPWGTEAIDLIRAVSGGLLFGIPLLYTMEVWWIGSYAQPGRVLAVLVLTFLPVLFLNRTSGFRSTRDVRLVDAAVDSVETVALGIVSAALLLALLQEVTLDSPLREALGKVVYEATPFGIGIALAHHFLRRGRAEGDDGGDSRSTGALHATVADLGATVIGAVFIAFNVAPTDEVPVLAATMDPSALLAVMAVSLVVSFCIVFVAGFSDEERRRSQPGVIQHPVTETVVCYLVALATAGAMLWYFGRLDLSAPWQQTLSHVVVLGLPASVGGAAGRLAT